jgi:hypothetical protein
MARSLASRLDRLERLAEEVLNQQLGSVYLREGNSSPRGSNGRPGDLHQAGLYRSARASCRRAAGNRGALSARLSSILQSPADQLDQLAAGDRLALGFLSGRSAEGSSCLLEHESS